MVPVRTNIPATDLWALLDSHTRSHPELADLDRCARWVLRWAHLAARALLAPQDHKWGLDHDPSHQQGNDLSHRRSDLSPQVNRAHLGLNLPTARAGDRAHLGLLECSRSTGQTSTAQPRSLPKVPKVLPKVLLREQSQESQYLVRRTELVSELAHRQEKKFLDHLVGKYQVQALFMSFGGDRITTPILVTTKRLALRDEIFERHSFTLLLLFPFSQFKSRPLLTHDLLYNLFADLQPADNT